MPQQSPALSVLAPRRGVDEWNGAELAASDEPDIESLPVFGQEHICVVGWAMLLAGYPKSGKTSLLIQLVRAWLDGGRRVLWLTEEPRTIWRRRLLRVGGDWSGLTLVPGDPSQESELRARAAGGDEGIVIVDTLRQFLPVRDWDDAAVIASTLRPWVSDLSRIAGKTTILSHHARKGGGENGEEIAGSHELFAAVDVGITLKRDGDQRRKLTVLGREIETKSLVYEMLSDEPRTLRCLGEPEAVGLVQVQTRIRAVLSTEWLTTVEVRDGLGEPRPSKQQVLRALNASAASNSIERDPPLGQPTERRTLRWRHLQTVPTPTSGAFADRRGRASGRESSACADARNCLQTVASLGVQTDAGVPV